MRKIFVLLISLLGFWTIATALTFAHEPKLLASDIANGLLLILLAVIAHFSKRAWSVVAVCLLGLWMQLAPLVFWTNEAWHYTNATFCGIFAMGLSLRTLARAALPAREEMPYNGWSFNPSSWNFRLPNVFLSLLCAFLARYLAAFQLGLIPTVWDPIFGEGTYKVLTSTVSHAFPIPDAGLGALAYMIEALMGCQGDAQRFRTMPWAVILFGFLVVPVSIVSIALIILQPLAVGAWCSWCLLIGFIMVFMIPLAVAEFVAGLRFLHQNFRQGKSFWRLFWHGEELSAKVVSAPFLRASPLFSPQGVSFPWNLIVCALLALWMIFSAHLFALPRLIADTDYVAGPFIFTISIVSFAEVIRAGRFLNIPLALWLLASPWFAGEVSSSVVINHMLCGLAILLLSFPRGPIHQRYGKWERFIF